MKFRKLITLATMCLSLAGVTACGTSNNNETEKSTEIPTEVPTEKPTEAPTEKPTEAPTEKPTEAPTEKPTEAPTEKPTEAPTEKPTEAPTEKPMEAPTEKPTEKPTEAPTEKPTEKPTEAPTKNTMLNPEEHLKRGVAYLFYYKLSDTQVEVHRIYFSEDGSDVSSSMNGYIIESSWEYEKSDNFITYNGEKYYSAMWGILFEGTYNLTDKTIEVVVDDYYGGGSITFKMLTEDSIVIESVDGLVDERFEVGKAFVLSE